MEFVICLHHSYIIGRLLGGPRGGLLRAPLRSGARARPGGHPPGAKRMYTILLYTLGSPKNVFICVRCAHLNLLSGPLGAAPFTLFGAPWAFERQRRPGARQL